MTILKAAGWPRANRYLPTDEICSPIERSGDASVAGPAVRDVA